MMKKVFEIPQADECDVMLLLEGTFPYVSGGVSSWVNQIIMGFPEIRFGICFIGSQSHDYGGPKYVLPTNVVHLEIHYINEIHVRTTRIKPSKHSNSSQLLKDLHISFRDAHHTEEPSAAIAENFHRALPLMEEGMPFDESSFYHSPAAWENIKDQYTRFCEDPSFVDYFWTARIMHAPLWKLNKIAKNMIPARCYHSISTGYAGLLGAILKQKTGRPLLLSEHGIYTKERKIDLFQSEWIRDNRGVFEKDAAQISYLRDLWMRFFSTLGRLCYQASDEIISLYEVNRLRQVTDGAPYARTRSIPNGIDLPRLKKLRDLRPSTPPQVLCLIGRVVPIKDVKTFIRSMRTVVNLLPDAEAWIAGPEDENPEYAKECRSIAAGLDLSDKVRFLGFQNIDDLLPKIGLVVLSSISEALPLVLLEGFAAGVPAVATDVGSCRQLLYGLEGEDQSLGAAGSVVNIADPEALAHAAIALLQDNQRWHAAQAAGIARVERYYTQDLMFNQYGKLYEKALHYSTKPPTTSVCPFH